MRWVVEESRKHLRLIEIGLVMYPQVVSAVLVAYVHELRFVTVYAYPFVFLSTEYQWFALLQHQRLSRAAAFFSEYFEGTVIEDVTVLVDLQKRSSVMAV